jgi:hypothetical protein
MTLTLKETRAISGCFLCQAVYVLGDLRLVRGQLPAVRVAVVVPVLAH